MNQTGTSTKSLVSGIIIVVLYFQLKYCLGSFSHGHSSWKHHQSRRGISGFCCGTRSTLTRIRIFDATGNYRQGRLESSKTFPESEGQVRIHDLPSPLSSSSSPSSAEKWLSTNSLVSVIRFALHSFLLALMLIAWEETQCDMVLPSRQTRTMVMQLEQDQKREGEADSGPGQALWNGWGQVTVRGMGFGREDRLLMEGKSPILAESNAKKKHLPESQQLQLQLPPRPSYNEVLLYHRSIRVPQWRTDHKVDVSVMSEASKVDLADAIHTLCECLDSLLFTLKDKVQSYQWEAVQSTLSSAPWSNLELAASRLRSIDEAVGFDWGSCAWRGGAGQCNALADAQEALDELDSLVGVLEPYEALFCLDVVERSLRDILVVIPWDEYSRPVDKAFWNSKVPPYKPHRVFDPIVTGSSWLEDDTSGLNGDIIDSESIDKAYIEALQSLRID